MGTGVLDGVTGGGNFLIKSTVDWWIFCNHYYVIIVISLFLEQERNV